ncbi:MAG: hypothetical protein ACTS8S_11660 [Giesbergeria sp.]
MLKILRYVLFAGTLSLSILANAGQNEYSTLEKLPEESQAAVATLLDWQESMEDFKVSAIRSKFGKPNSTENLGINSVSGKSMQMLSYRLAPGSLLQFTIHQGEVAAVSIILIPMTEEDDPGEN